MRITPLSVNRAAAAGLLCLALPWASPVWAAQHYTLTDIGDLPGGDNWSSAHAMNERGHVAGVSSSTAGKRIFLWTAETGMQEVGAFNGYVMDLNSDDMLIAEGDTFPSQFWLYAPGSGFRRIEDVIGDSRISSVNCINDLGTVVGSRSDSWSGAITWNAASGVSIIDAPWRLNTGPGDINNAGQFVGDIYDAAPGLAAYRWDPQSGVTLLGDLPGGSYYSEAWGMNNLGHVVGVSKADVSHYMHAYLWTPEHGMVDLGKLPGMTEVSYYAVAVNDHDEVVGLINGGTVAESRGFVWNAVDGMHLLVELVAPSDPLFGQVHIGWAAGINNRGQIAVTALVDGAERAMLMTPVDDGTGAGETRSVPWPGWSLGLLAGALLVHGAGSLRRPARRADR